MMMGKNGYSHHRYIPMMLAFIDCLLIIVGVFIGGILRFGGVHSFIVISGYSVWKIIPVLLVIQIGFYYFDLYELIYLRELKKIALSLVKSLGISFLLLAILYYSIPSLVLGRGILGLSLLMIFVLVFVWRLIFAGISRKIMKERILIVGTGPLSQKIAGDIYENGRDSFEIVGFVEEWSGAAHRSPESADYRRL